VRFHYRDEGRGQPFVFQHGLGGDVAQPFGFFEPIGTDTPFRLVSMDFRVHGETRPVGPEDRISIAGFADDVVALMDRLGVAAAVIGGISMGAAVSLNLVLRYPARVSALILSRPAWLDKPAPPNLEPIVEVGRLIRKHGAAEGLRRFKASACYATIAQESPDVAASLAGQFEQPRAEECVVRLERIPRDAPCADRSAWSSIQVPALVMANRQDPVHPFAYGEELARAIPGAVFREITPKSVSVERHGEDVRSFVFDFLAGLPA
jgi:pimeloyl-ACP methyl ester carboxylesterase